MGKPLWNRDPGAIRVTAFPVTRASPPGVPELYFPVVAYPELSGAEGYTTGDWATLGVTAALLAALGVLIARSA